MITKYCRLWRTVRHLRPVQVINRLQRRWPIRVPPAVDLPLAATTDWATAPERRQSWLDGNRFCFLNHEAALQWPAGWNDPSQAKLWLYNLHYHDWLRQGHGDGQALRQQWIHENPAASGNGWEPYPISLRVVNWCIAHLQGQAPMDGAARASLYQQVRVLEQRLEYHLLGNHLWANAKALLFAGALFAGNDAKRWLRKGLALWQREVAEQVLPDGGHFERSPMYQGILTEDMLDVCNLAQACGWKEHLPAWQAKAQTMLQAFMTLHHPDGEVAFFNDATSGIATPLPELLTYGERLGIALPTPAEAGLPKVGFARWAQGSAMLLADVGSVGPSYQPGHAHAETLSFELSVHGQRLLVNSGISQYGTGEIRWRQRSGAAHTCLLIDDAESSEIWGSHRVGARARVHTVQRNDAMLAASHTGYRRLRGVGDHRRTWSLLADRLTLQDTVQGSGRHRLQLIFVVHPDWQVSGGPNSFSLQRDHLSAVLNLPAGMAGIVESWQWHPGFGLSVPTVRIVGHLEADLPCTLTSEITWANSL